MWPNNGTDSNCTQFLMLHAKTVTLIGNAELYIAHKRKRKVAESTRLKYLPAGQEREYLNRRWASPMFVVRSKECYFCFVDCMTEPLLDILIQ